MKKICLLLIASLLLSGCAQTGAGDATPVRVALDWLPNTNHTGMYVALDKGYYADAGLDVIISEPPEDGALIMLSAGRADFAVSFQDEMAVALTAQPPLPVVAVAAVVSHNTSGIMSAKDKGIVSPKDMENRSYATWDMPIEKAVIQHVVEKDGGQYDAIEMIPSMVTDVMTALQTTVDAIWVYYAWDGVAAEVKGLDTNFFYFRDIDPALDFYTPVLASSAEYLENNKDTAEKFLKATAKGYEYAVAHPEEAADILCKYAPETNAEIARRSQLFLAGEYISDAEAWGYIDQARWDAFYAWLYDNGLVSAEFEPGQGFTNDYLPR